MTHILQQGKTMEFCYKRVSTIDQNLDRQLPGVAYDREYLEKVSGKDMNRPQLQALLQNVREGDRVHVHELSRLGRSVKDLLDIVEQIVQSGAAIIFHKEGLEFGGGKKSPFQSLMLNLLSSIAQFERDLLLDRQREGIQIAKVNGKYKGKKSKFSEEDIQLIQRSFGKAKNKAELAKKWGISRGYLYQLAKNC
jgi:DNA invertase Pin-like site-specific DNA recombinase